MDFEWDEAKSATNLRERGFGFAHAAGIFRGRVVVVPDDRRAYGEIRLRAVGSMDDRLLHVVYTMRGGTCRIISARPANRKERMSWRSSE